MYFLKINILDKSLIQTKFNNIIMSSCTTIRKFPLFLPKNQYEKSGELCLIDFLIEACVLEIWITVFILLKTNQEVL